jgi:FAD binding domain
MQDAYNLGWKLSAVLAGAPAGLLDTYEEERLPIAAWLLGATTKLHREVFQSNADLHRDEQFLQLALNYRGGPLSQGETSLSTTLQPGDRAPDSPLLDHQGRQVRLFDLFRGPHFTLLEFATTVDENPAEHEPFGHRYKILRTKDAPLGENEFIDPKEHIWKSYGVESDALLLIRPDGYIGFIGDRKTARRVKDYLRNMQPQMI